MVSEAPVAAVDARRALRNLHRLSLVTHDPNDALRSVRIHALTQRWVSETLDRNALADVVRAAADAVLEAWPDVEGHSGLGEVLRANATTLAGRDPLAVWEPAVHPVVFRAGRSLGEAGLVAEAVAHFQASVDNSGRLLSCDHPDTLSARYELAYWRGEAGDFASAAESQSELLADRLRILGPDHPDTLGTRASLAYWQGHAGDPAGAAAATKAVIADLVRVLGPDHITTLSARHNLADWQGGAGDAAGAAAALRQLLHDQIPILGPDHPDTLAVRHNLAYWQAKAADTGGAAAAFRELLQDQLRVFGPDHPDPLPGPGWGHGTDRAAGVAEEKRRVLPGRYLELPRTPAAVGGAIGPDPREETLSSRTAPLPIRPDLVERHRRWLPAVRLGIFVRGLVG